MSEVAGREPRSRLSVRVNQDTLEGQALGLAEVHRLVGLALRLRGITQDLRREGGHVCFDVGARDEENPIVAGHHRVPRDGLRLEREEAVAEVGDRLVAAVRVAFVVDGDETGLLPLLELLDDGRAGESLVLRRIVGRKGRLPVIAHQRRRDA